VRLVARSTCGRFLHRGFWSVGAAAALVLLAGVVAAPAALAASVQPTVGLGTATPFAVLAGQSVNNTGPSVVSGDLGVSPGTAVTGFPPGTVTNGTIHAADAVAAQAEADLTTAYNDAAGRTPADAVSTDLGGQTLAPGVYNAASSMGLTGTVTLDAGGNPNAVFIFQAGSTLITASNSTVSLINGGSPCNVFWQVGSSATLGTDTTFVGSILALTSASVQTGSTVAGRVLARNGSVTLDDNSITRPNCATTPPGGTTPPVVVPPITTPPIIIGPITIPPITIPPISVPPATPPGGGGENGGGGDNGGGDNGGGGNGGGENSGGDENGGGNGGGGNGGQNGGDENDGSGGNGGDENGGGGHEGHRGHGDADGNGGHRGHGGGSGNGGHGGTGGAPAAAEAVTTPGSQITQVPVGSVETGNGSSTGDSEAAYYLLLAGALVAGGAGVFWRARRKA
jgi:LPXTG-motif cell wall-anchored protein